MCIFFSQSVNSLVASAHVFAIKIHIFACISYSCLKIVISITGKNQRIFYNVNKSDMTFVKYDMKYDMKFIWKRREYGDEYGFGIKRIWIWRRINSFFTTKYQYIFTIFLHRVQKYYIYNR